MHGSWKCLQLYILSSENLYPSFILFIFPPFLVECQLISAAHLRVAPLKQWVNFCGGCHHRPVHLLLPEWHCDQPFHLEWSTVCFSSQLRKAPSGPFTRSFQSYSFLPHRLKKLLRVLISMMHPELRKYPQGDPHLSGHCGPTVGHCGKRPTQCVTFALPSLTPVIAAPWALLVLVSVETLQA